MPLLEYRAWDRSVLEHVEKYRGSPHPPRLESYDLSYKFCQWWGRSFMKQVFEEGCLHATLYTYGFARRAHLRVTTNPHEALNKSMKYCLMALTDIYQKRGICLNTFQCVSVRWYTKFYGCLKAALGGFAPRQWGGLVSSDCLVPPTSTTDRIGKVIDLKKVSDISMKAWCGKIFDQIDSLHGDVFYEDVIDKMILADETPVAEPMSYYVPNEARIDAALADSDRSKPLETYSGARWGNDEWIGLLMRCQASSGHHKLMSSEDAANMLNMAISLQRGWADPARTVAIEHNRHADPTKYTVRHEFDVCCKVKVKGQDVAQTHARTGTYVVHLSQGRATCTCIKNVPGANMATLAKRWCPHKIMLCMTQRLEIQPLVDKFVKNLKTMERARMANPAAKNAFGFKPAERRPRGDLIP